VYWLLLLLRLLLLLLPPLLLLLLLPPLLPPLLLPLGFVLLGRSAVLCPVLGALLPEWRATRAEA
jgi:hypothetical protein